MSVVCFTLDYTVAGGTTVEICLTLARLSHVLLFSLALHAGPGSCFASCDMYNAHAQAYRPSPSLAFIDMALILKV